ncbi:MAG: clostripain-related cysteine peptidase [Candidatus Thorarchaeota archaeon]
MDFKNKLIRYCNKVVLILIIFSCIVPNSQALSIHEFSQSKKSIPFPTLESLNATWTLMMYLDGDNDLEVTAVDILKQCEKGLTNIQQITIVAMIDRINNFYGLDGNWLDTRIFLVKPDDHDGIDSELLETLNEMNMGSSSTLEYFLTYCLTNFPADNYLLNIYDHGNGVFGICQDFTNNDILTLNEIQIALHSSFLISEVDSLDIICFSACNMATLEVAYELRNYAQYFLASEASTLTGNLNWDDIIDRLEEKSMSVKTFVDEIILSCSLKWSETNDARTFSVIDLTQLDSISELNPFTNLLQSNLENLTIFESLISIRKLAQGFDDMMYQINPISYLNKKLTNTIYIDIINFLSLLQKDSLIAFIPGLNSSITILLAQLEKVIVGNFQHTLFTGKANGLMIFYPFNEYNLMKEYVENYCEGKNECLNVDFLHQFSWTNFLAEFYYQDKDNDSLVDWYEMEIHSDPQNNESLAIGVEDSMVDIDFDSLINLYEYQNGSDPILLDTDFDQLSDYQEVVIYGTLPFMFDSDQDGFSDYTEIKQGTDPLDKTNFPKTKRFFEIGLPILIIIPSLIIISILFSVIKNKRLKRLEKV